MQHVSFEIDAELPGRMGDAELCAPTEHELLELCGQHLALLDASRAKCTHARWKRATSLTTSWSVHCASGEAVHVVLKRYSGRKAELLAARELRPGHLALAELRLAAWRFPSDRELPGLERLFDLHRTTRLLASLRSLDPWVARWNTSSVEVLRYKPEHRAVLRLDLDLRRGDKHGEKSRGFLAARALRPDDAAGRIERRLALEDTGGPGPWPRFLGGQARTGLLFEAWIPGATCARDDFRLAGEAGALLRELHARELPASVRDSADDSRSISDLFDGDESLSSLARRIQAPPLAARSWIHGDVHPDQLSICSPAGVTHLLDLDGLDAGDPHRDLGCWIADHLSRDRSLSLEDAAGLLLAGYAHAVYQYLLRLLVSFELWVLAAGALRRLEPGAQARAGQLLERALDLVATRTRGA